MSYLQDQAVMNFAGTAARGSAIGTAVSQGMVSFMGNTGNIEAYYGTFGTANPGGATPAGWYPMPRLLFAATATRSLVSGTAYTVGTSGFSYTKQLDPLSWQNPSVNPERITPNIAGYYRLTTAYDSPTVNGTSVRQYFVAKNGARITGGFLSINDASSNHLNLNGAFIVSMNGTTDFFTLANLVQTSGSTITGEITVAVEYLRPNV
jgi:hypothetical protein